MHQDDVGDWRIRAFMAQTPEGRAIAEKALRERGVTPPTAEEYEKAKESVAIIRSW